MINLAIDGGGSKINIVAFDESYRLVGYGKAGGVNTRYESREQVATNIDHAFSLCMVNIEQREIGRVYCTMLGSERIFMKIMEDLGYRVGQYIMMSEGYTCLLAGSLSDKGYVSLSGTGSGSIYCDGKDKIIHLGGFGIPIGDDGSGAWIGIKGINAATRFFDAWGQETSLAKELLSFLGVESNPSKILDALYPNDKNPRGMYASFSLIVGREADLGDMVAQKIVIEGGEILALQLIGLVRLKNDISVNRYETDKELLSFDEIRDLDVNIYACGGGWKSSKLMFDAFNRKIKEFMPNANCNRALFEPVIGGLIQCMLDDSNPIDLNYLEKEYKDFYIGDQL